MSIPNPQIRQARKDIRRCSYADEDKLRTRPLTFRRVELTSVPPDSQNEEVTSQ